MFFIRWMVAGLIAMALSASARADVYLGPNVFIGPNVHFGAGGLTGQVTKVRDGGTLEIRGAAIRLLGLYAPIITEPGGREARRFMADLVLGRTIRCDLTGERTEDWHVGICFLGDRDIAATLVNAGLGLDCPSVSHGRYRALERPEARRRLSLPAACRRR